VVPFHETLQLNAISCADTIIGEYACRTLPRLAYTTSNHCKM
jgi:hypothetical protein